MRRLSRILDAIILIGTSVLLVASWWLIAIIVIAGILGLIYD